LQIVSKLQNEGDLQFKAGSLISIKEGGLFVLLVMIRSPTPRPHALATVGKSLMSVPVHLSGLVVFRPPMQELLNIEQLC
jgi:hypothetical protein